MVFGRNQFEQVQHIKGVIRIKKNYLVIKHNAKKRIFEQGNRNKPKISLRISVGELNVNIRKFTKIVTRASDKLYSVIKTYRGESSLMRILLSRR